MTEHALEIEHDEPTKPANKALQKREDQPRQEVASVSESAAIFQIIERAARDQNVDIDKMQRLMEMREREMARVAKQAFNAAMKAAQAEMPQVVRGAENSHTKSSYAKYEAISAAMQPIIDRHGFSLSFGTEDSPLDGHKRIVCDVGHEEGFEKRFHLDLPVDGAGAQGKANKNPTQAVGSTLSYGRRYLKTLIFDVAVKDEDDDGQSAGDTGGVISEEQRSHLQALIERAGGDTPTFCAWAKIESLSDLPAASYAKAKIALETKIQQKKQAND
jgi:hypothetical protein